MFEGNDWDCHRIYDIANHNVLSGFRTPQTGFRLSQPPPFRSLPSNSASIHMRISDIKVSSRQRNFKLHLRNRLGNKERTLCVRVIKKSSRFSPGLDNNLRTTGGRDACPFQTSSAPSIESSRSDSAIVEIRSPFKLSQRASLSSFPRDASSISVFQYPIRSSGLPISAYAD